MAMATRQIPAALLLSGLLLCFELLGLACLCRGDSRWGHPCRDAEREALLQFKRGLHDAADRLSSWVDGSDCCGWSGVGCSNRTGHVIKLDLGNPHPIVDDSDSTPYNRWSLRGEINPSLLGLKHLAHLDLSMNYFGGSPMPAFMGSLQRLRYLNLSRAGLGGTVPHQLGNLSRLHTLDLSKSSWDFRVDLAVDNAGWVSRLSSLRRINMENVVISSESNGLLEALNTLPSISSVRLQGCWLQSLPALPHVNFTSLSVLDLSGNWMNSSFPAWLPNITSLEYLDISCNTFQGGIPSAIGSLASLQVFKMYGTYRLDGELPTSLSNLCKLQVLDLSFMNINKDISELEGSFSGCIRHSLQSLDLGGNQLNGSLPGWLGELKRLKHLSLNGNSLQGPIPEFFGRISSLETLGLSWNLFQGSIPKSLGDLSSLQTLSLQQNNLSGLIPESFGGLSSLQVLSLQGNNLAGIIPQSLGSLSSLQRLTLRGNNLNGTIPESLGGLSKLVELDVSFNHLEGTISIAHFSNMSGLRRLAMASNPLAVHISPHWVPPFRLRDVDMSSCKLGPHFPAWLRLQQEVSLLNLSNSGISDSIPNSYWSSTSNIQNLDLSNNEISGRLLDSLKQIPVLTSVTLRSNHLEGELPRLSSEMTFLDLSNNSFSGAMPRDVGKMMPSLTFLSLSYNRFNDSIPKSLCQLQHLAILDLSRNNLSGDIPNCWKPSFSYSLEVLNLAHNSLVGVIPNSLGSLSNLVTVQLNGNNLSGGFPLSLKTCSSMSTFDLGENRFTGNIPTWLAESMPFLMVLRLRSNNFTGNIPPNLSALTSLQVIDLANNDLMGTIPQCFGNFTAMKFIHIMIEAKGRNRSFSDYYSAVVNVVTKGREMEYQKLLSLVISIDLSNNKLSGSIPRGVADLEHLRKHVNWRDHAEY